MPTNQARSFPGAAASDILTSANTLPFAQLTSWYCRLNINTSDATTRRIIYWLDTTVLAEIAIISGVLNFFVYTPGVWSTGTGQWQIGTPSLSAEHDLLVTYDAGLTTNVPVAYLDGSTTTITPVTTPTGTSTFTNAALVSVGNRQGASPNRCFDGWLSTVAIWKGILLSAGDATSLHAGTAPCGTNLAQLAFYAPLENGDSPEVELITANNLTVTGTTVVAGSTIIQNARCLVASSMRHGRRPGKIRALRQRRQSTPEGTLTPTTGLVFRKTLSPVGTRTGSRQGHNTD